MCGTHYAQWRKGRPLTEVTRDAPNLMGKPCLACAKNGAERPSIVRIGLCCTHYDRKRTGQPDWDRPIARFRPVGSGTMSPDGYRYVVYEGRRYAEHRLFMAQLLGRPLREGENVHHRNTNRSDNRTNGPLVMDSEGRLWSGNLELWQTSQPPGGQIGPKLDWAAELFTQYGGYDMEATRKLVATGMAILGQIGTAQERKAAASFARLMSASGAESPGAELHSALF